MLLSTERDYYSLIDWRTIASLGILMVVSKGMEESRYFNHLVRQHAHRFRKERQLALFFISVSFFLSMFLTNDISLFIIVPLSLAFSRNLGMERGKLVVFEAIAVNSGSAISPVGNPQNIFLWGFSGLNFISFMYFMLPLGIILYILLMIFVFLSFSNKELRPVQESDVEIDHPLILLSFALLLLSIIAIEMDMVYSMFFLIIILYLPFRKVLVRSDWLLLASFFLMFLDFGLLSEIPALHGLSTAISENPFIYSVLLSQAMSNVPATIFVSSFSTDWKSIAYGVNLAGNGLIIASMANIIAVRLSGIKGIVRTFHRYSVPFFLASLSIILLIAKLF